MNTRTKYVIGVIIVWAVILCIARFYFPGQHFERLSLVCAGFMLGMISAFTAVAVYKS